MKQYFSIASDPANLKDLRLYLWDFFLRAELNFGLFNKVLLGLSEVVNNAIVHGNKLDKRRRVHVLLQFDKNVLIIDVWDEGEGFNFNSLNDPTCSENLKKENGRGIFLLIQTANSVEFLEGGRRVLFQYNLD